MSEHQVLEPPVDERVAAGGDPSEIAAPPAASLRRRLGLRIVAVVVGALLALGAAFGGGVLVGRGAGPGGAPTQGQFGDGGPRGGVGGAPGDGAQQGGTPQNGTQGGPGSGSGDDGSGA